MIKEYVKSAAEIPALALDAVKALGRLAGDGFDRYMAKQADLGVDDE